MFGFSHCGECGRKLRDCIFCHQCCNSVCLACFEKHRKLHENIMSSRLPPETEGLARSAIGTLETGRFGLTGAGRDPAINP